MAKKCCQLSLAISIFIKDIFDLHIESGMEPMRAGTRCGVNRVGYQECGSTPGYGLRLSRAICSIIFSVFSIPSSDSSKF